MFIRKLCYAKSPKGCVLLREREMGMSPVNGYHRGLGVIWGYSYGDMML